MDKAINPSEEASDAAIAAGAGGDLESGRQVLEQKYAKMDEDL